MSLYLADFNLVACDLVRFHLTVILKQNVCKLFIQHLVHANDCCISRNVGRTKINSVFKYFKTSKRVKTEHLWRRILKVFQMKVLNLVLHHIIVFSETGLFLTDFLKSNKATFATDKIIILYITFEIKTWSFFSDNGFTL